MTNIEDLLREALDRVNELLGRIGHRPDLTRVPGNEQYGGDGVKTLQNMWKDCPCLPDCTPCQLKAAIDRALSLSSPIEPQDPAEMREEADIHSGYATPRWLVYFDDLDRGPIAFHTEVEARKFYEDSKVAWSCHLFVLVPSRPTSQASSEVRELLLRHGFVRVFCGFDGEFYYACKQCNAYSPGHNHVEVTPELAKHNEDCKLNALLAPSRQGAAKRVEG